MTTATDHIPKLRFSGFNAAWSSREVGDIAKIKHGYAFKGEFFADSGAYVVLTPGNFQLGGGFRYQGDKEKYYSDPDFPKDYILQRGDLVTAMTEQAVGLIGSPLVVPEDGKFLHNQRLGLFQFAEGEKTGFLYFSMQTSSMRREFSNSAAGSKVRHTSPKRIESLPLKIPTLTEQRKIADFLTAMDGRIGQLIQKKALLEDYKKGVMQQLFTQAIRFKDDHGNDFPDWEEKKLIDVADSSKKWSFTGGPFGSNLKSEDYTEDGIRIIQLQNIGDGEFLNDYQIYTSEEKANELLSCNIYPGDLILSKMGDPVARACIIPNHEERYVMCSDGIRLAVDESRFDRYFVFCQINHRTFRNSAITAGTGSTRKRIGLTELRELPILAPSIAEQSKIGNFLTSLDRKIESVVTQITETQTFKRGLLQQMFV